MREKNAKQYLLSIVADINANCFDRRDAAAVLCNFKLNDSDIQPIKKLLIDLNPGFWGGHVFAAEAIANIGSSEALSLLRKAYSTWEHSDYSEKGLILNHIKDLLVTATQEFNLDKTINRYFDRKQMDNIRVLPGLVAQFHNQQQDKAEKLFLETIIKYKGKFVYGGTGTWAIIQVLPKIPLTRSLINAALDLAMRVPKDDFIGHRLRG